jgi:SAM-dependent methyltransferase
MTIIRTLALGAGLVAVGGATFFYWAFGAFLPWRERAEADRLFEVAGIGPGQTVADVGAGTGRFSQAAALRVGDSGRVFSTETSEKNRQAIRARADRARLPNITVVEAGALRTNLPDSCCDVVFLRNVYHHIRGPEELARSVRAALRPDGRLVVIDFEPGALWFHGNGPAEAADRRPGHGVARADAVAEFTAAGFRLERDIARWSGPMWLLLFRATDSAMPAPIPALPSVEPGTARSRFP